MSKYLARLKEKIGEIPPLNQVSKVSKGALDTLDTYRGSHVLPIPATPDLVELEERKAMAMDSVPEPYLDASRQPKGAGMSKYLARLKEKIGEIPPLNQVSKVSKGALDTLDTYRGRGFPRNDGAKPDPFGSFGSSEGDRSRAEWSRSDRPDADRPRADRPGADHRGIFYHL